MGEASELELLYSLIGFPAESEWLEFKEGNSDPERIGRDISALANSAAYLGREYAYKIWGVTDDTHRLVGTAFDPDAKTVGKQPLKLWLRTMLSPNASYEFCCFSNDGLDFVILTIRAATNQPVYFQKTAYIREGGSTTQLGPGSAKERELWARLQGSDFELRSAEQDDTADEVFAKLDTTAYFQLLGLKAPSSREGAIQALCEQDLLALQDNGRYTITNVGALLIGRTLTSFRGLRKRPLRVVRYQGKGSFDILSDTTFDKGYALALPEAEAHIMSLVALEERADGAFRRVEGEYPQRAVRELLVNAVIHQDLSDATSGPLVGIYENRMVFSNPGASLIEPERVLNAQPKTRNNSLVGLLRQMDLCEEAGTGWDLVVAACEDARMAAPKIESADELGTRVTLFRRQPFERMSGPDRRNAVYWHACLLYAQGDSMSNQTLRERFGLGNERKSVVAMSRLIRECCDDGLIKPEDEESGTKYRRYVPHWA